jgi:DNA-binding beta-propeller fold protein YncE
VGPRNSIATGGVPTHLAVNPVMNQIYVADQLSPSVFVIDGATDAFTTIPVSFDVGGENVSVNTAMNRAYVISRDSQHVMVVDGTSDTQVDTLNFCCGFVGATAFDSSSNVLYVNHTTNVETYDGSTDALLNSLSISPTTLYGMGVNPTTGELWSTAVGSGYVLLAFGHPDTTAPVINVPGLVTAKATSPSGATVTYSVSANDPDDAASTPACSPASGSFFPVGVTTVNCTSSDTHGNIGSASFLVDVTALGADCTLGDYPVVKGTSYLNLKGATLSGCYLVKANLAKAVASNTNLKAADLAEADLGGTDLTQANLASAILINANLTGANLSGTNLAGAKMTGAILTGVTWSQTTCPDGTTSNDDGGTCVGHLG